MTGNHDHSWMGKFNYKKYFVSIDKYLEVNDGKHLLIMMHYPMVSYTKQRRDNTYMIHGHIRNDTGADFWPCLLARERVLNAGVDINGFMPVTFDELVANNKRFKFEHQNDAIRPFGVGRHMNS